MGGPQKGLEKFIGFIGLIGFIGFIGFMGLIGLIGFRGLGNRDADHASQIQRSQNDAEASQKGSQSSNGR